MTGEEMERAIEFLLKSQADISARQDRTDAQIAETGRQLCGLRGDAKRLH